MTDKKIYRLNQSKTFCMAPWVHIHNLPSGEILPCCINNQTLKIGNLYEDSVENIWNNEHIDSVRIRTWETLGLEKRGSFYDPLGTIRDVGQNHLLEMLALITMERPKERGAKAARFARGTTR